MANAISAPRTAPRAIEPWTQTLVAAIPVAPAWVGLGVALANLGLCVLSSTFGRSHPSRTADSRAP